METILSLGQSLSVFPCIGIILDSSLSKGNVTPQGTEVCTDLPGEVRSKICYIAGNCIHGVKEKIKKCLTNRLNKPGQKKEVMRFNVT